MARARFIVRGVVQGVNFRATAVREASRLGISGRVWTREDGGVELIAEGDDEALRSLQTWLNAGPRGARVSDVERSELGGKPRYEGFNITWSEPREN
jgi:acylphosphatase